MKSQANTYQRDGRAPIPKKESTSKTMSAIKDRNTKLELLLRKALWNEGIKGYRLHWKNAPGKPDVSFPGKKFAVFVNGCFWHRCPHCQPPMPKTHSDFWREKFKKNIERDKIKIELLTTQNWKVMVILECEIKNDLNTYVDKIKFTLREWINQES